MTDVYSHPDYQQFLARIREQPADDVVRLVFADWLEDRGQGDRAEFIRVQVERARSPDRAACDRCRKDWQRVNKSSYPVPMSYCPTCRTDGPFWPDVVDALRLRDRASQLKAANDWRCWTDDDEKAGLNTFGDRGFVSRVSGPLAALHGGECERCQWRGLNLSDGGHFDCHICPGTGRTPGVLAELIRREPVTAEGVEVTDFQPIQINGGSWSLAQWRLSHGQRDLAASLPYETFPTADSARLALSRVLYSIHAPKSEVLT